MGDMFMKMGNMIDIVMTGVTETISLIASLKKKAKKLHLVFK
jgi:hypothetical protein